MCFYIHKDHSESKVATEDIVCYKAFVVEDYPVVKDKTKLYSIVQLYPYDQNRRYAMPDPIKPDIHKIEIEDNTISKGFHSYATRREHYWNRAIYIECYIPKGANYYYNPMDEEYVSDELFVTGYDKKVFVKK